MIKPKNTCLSEVCYQVGELQALFQHITSTSFGIL